MPRQKEGNKRLWEIGELDWNQFGRSVDLMGMGKNPWERERERVDLMGMGKTHGRWRGEGDEETWVRERERVCVWERMN